MSGGAEIDYEALAQSAMRSVVRAVLARVAKSGLPGEHHFYIAFSTQAPGVVVSKRLREKYNDEMTIVLQHRFWDLTVTEECFEVKLTFDSIPERLTVPFSAVKVFFDPSVPYGLQFEGGAAGDQHIGARVGHDQAQEGEPETAGGGATATNGGDEARLPRPFTGGDRADKKRTPRRARTDLRPDKATERPSPAHKSSEKAPSLRPVPTQAEPPAKAGKPDGARTDGKPGKAPALVPGAKVLSLDAFRKK